MYKINMKKYIYTIRGRAARINILIHFKNLLNCILCLSKSAMGSKTLPSMSPLQGWLPAPFYGWDWVWLDAWLEPFILIVRTTNKHHHQTSVQWLWLRLQCRWVMMTGGDGLLYSRIQCAVLYNSLFPLYYYTRQKINLSSCYSSDWSLICNF